MAHPDVLEAAVIAVPDDRWEERPAGLRRAPAGLGGRRRGRWSAFLADQVARWWLPERWAFLDEIPKTSVGKFDKKELRSRHAAGLLPVTELADRSAE